MELGVGEGLKRFFKETLIMNQFVRPLSLSVIIAVCMVPTVSSAVQVSFVDKPPICTGGTLKVEIDKNAVQKFFYPHAMFSRYTKDGKLVFISAGESKVTIWENGPGVLDREHCKDFIRYSNVAQSDGKYVTALAVYNKDSEIPHSACQLLSSSRIDQNLPHVRVALQVAYKVEDRKNDAGLKSDYFYYPYENGVGASTPTKLEDTTERIWGDQQFSNVDCVDVYVK